jgi:CRP/FNR family transcriptional regulator, transcriptional activator FtrB
VGPFVSLTDQSLHEMKGDNYKLLQTVPWFEGLSNQTLTFLCNHSRVQRFPAGTVLFSQGDIPDQCYVALEGSMELFVTHYNCKESLVEISNAPNAYTMAAVLTGAPYLVSGRTVTPTKILMVEAWALRKAAKTHPLLGLNLLGLVCWQFRAMVRQVISLKSKSTSERLGCYLLALLDVQKESAKVRLPLDKRRLAAKLGMTTMSLSRAFKILSGYGVETRGDNILIKNTNQLRAFSKPDENANEAERQLRVLID